MSIIDPQLSIDASKEAHVCWAFLGKEFLSVFFLKKFLSCPVRCISCMFSINQSVLKIQLNAWWQEFRECDEMRLAPRWPPNLTKRKSNLICLCIKALKSSVFSFSFTCTIPRRVSYSSTVHNVFIAFPIQVFSSRWSASTSLPLPWMCVSFGKAKVAEEQEQVWGQGRHGQQIRETRFNDEHTNGATDACT